MTPVYKVSGTGDTSPMKRVHCQDERAELQDLLVRNPDLLPGDQIDPDDPRRWILIRKEMPVPDPGTGGDRWSVDVVFADQSAVPTFVECKRQRDTRSRREVVAQMLEYAANGHQYWTARELRQHAEASASDMGADLEEAMQALGPDNELGVEQFFEAVENNLREGQLRLVFFMEESPWELRSIVDFLNGQMERAEILIVEARQFEQDGFRVVAPTLFGYTEQARIVKRPPAVPTAHGRRKWTRESFLDAARSRLTREEVGAVEGVLALCDRPGVTVSWGTGRDTGSFGVVVPEACPRSLVTVWTDGTLTVQLAWLRGSSSAEAMQGRLRQIADTLGFGVGDKHPNVRKEEWVPRADELARGLGELISEFTAT